MRTFQYDNSGAMYKGPELGRVRYNMDKSKEYQLIEIERILQPAHLIPAHLPSEKHEPAMAWYVNNCIDDQTWDLFYGSME